MKTEEPKTIYLKDYAAPDYLVDEVALEFDLGETETCVKSRLAFCANPERGAKGNSLLLLGEDLTLTALRLNGDELTSDAYDRTDTGLEISNVPEHFTLEVETRIRPSANTKLDGLYVSNGVFCTQCEAEGFRRITYFPDRPDVMAPYRVTIRADKKSCPVLLSNGNLVSNRNLENDRHEAVWHDPFPKPSYLFALVAGDLGVVEDKFITSSGRKVDLRIYVEHGNESRCAYAMDSLKRSMHWDEERFGLEYDLDIFNIVAVSDFNMGAMENKSLNVFNAKYILADADTETDTDFEGVESVVAHEYFHNWTGNRVTCRDWFQLSLKEGLTVYRDQEFSADMRSRPVQRISDVRSLRARQFPEDAGPLAHPVRPDSYMEINNFYTATVYEKGAEVIRMMARLLGREGFRKGMDLYFARHDGEAVTCDDFVSAMSEANDRDLTQFKRWYSQAGTPRVAAEGHYLAEERAYELTLTQSTDPTPGQPEKLPFHIPFEVGLIGKDGKPFPLSLEGMKGAKATDSIVLDLTEPSQSFRFLGVESSPVVSLNRGFTAPVNITTNRASADDLYLFAKDPDPFGRWEAGQRAATTLILDMVSDLKKGHEPQVDDAYVEALGHIAEDRKLDPAFAALLMTPPSEAYLAEQMDVVAVDEIHEVYEHLWVDIAHDLEEELRALYDRCRSNEPFSPDAVSAGKRSLKNTALLYLSALEDTDTLNLITAQFNTADNMTDRMGALYALNDQELPERDAALGAFYDRYQDDALVVDKWFAVQALSERSDTLEQVQNLMSHEAFTLRNPNKVRALIGSFAGGNQIRFHRADGAGYEFLADRILELDSLNPQIAARLVAPLGRWRRFDSERQKLMKQQLERILGTEGLSRDVFELASKSLG